MSVLFDLFLFNKTYVDEIRKKEKQESHHEDPEAELEIGAISCRHMDRKQPIFFYDVKELGELLEAGHAVGKDRDAHDQLIGTDAFPPDSVVPNMIELDKPVAGRFIDPDGKELVFASREELSAIVEGQLPDRS